jgi:alpha-amylase
MSSIVPPAALSDKVTPRNQAQKHIFSFYFFSLKIMPIQSKSKKKPKNKNTISTYYQCLMLIIFRQTDDLRQFFNIPQQFLRSRLWIWAFCLSTLSAHLQAIQPPPDVGPVPHLETSSSLPMGWHTRGPIAQIFVRAYQDSNGDGRGDLHGIILRLNYLKQLGVSGLWLMPVFPSQVHDHGYDVENFRAIERHYGTLNDMDALIKAAHAQGMAIILDYPLNHSASTHPLFESSRASRNSPFRDWYIWQNTKPTEWITFAGNPWREDERGWYYAIFGDNKPDFNLKNPQVLRFHQDNLRFWLNRGVDGFRFDAVGVLVENGEQAWENQPENIELLKILQKTVHAYPNRYTICEAPSAVEAFSQAKACDQMLGFGLNQQIIQAAQTGQTGDLLLSALQHLPLERLGTLLANHDSFTGGRLIEQLQQDEAAYRLAAFTLACLPGTPYIYYGEEIGMASTRGHPYGDIAVRATMSWDDSSPHHGFSTARKTFRPPASNADSHNVMRAEQDPDSLLAWYRQLGALRRQYPALAEGDFKLLTPTPGPLLHFVRSHPGTSGPSTQRLEILINYSKTAQARPQAGGVRIWPASTPHNTADTTTIPPQSAEIWQKP